MIIFALYDYLIYVKIIFEKIQEHNMVYHSTLRQQCRARHGSATYHTIQTKSVIHTSIIIQEFYCIFNNSFNVCKMEFVQPLIY